MDEDSSSVRDAIRDYETSYGAVQTAAYKAVELNLLFSQLRLIEDTNWHRELQTTMDELTLAHAYFHSTFKTARNSVNKLLIEMQDDLDAIQAKPEPVEPDVDDVIVGHNKDLTKANPEARAQHNKDIGPTGAELEKARETSAPEGTDAHNSASPKEIGEQKRDLPDPGPDKST